MSPPANTRAYTELEMANTLLHEEGATLDVQQDGSDELLSISLNIESWHEQATSTETSRECAEVSGESVLVVEPRRHIREIIKAELHVAGYRTDCVSQLKLDATADTDLLKETQLLVATFQGSVEDHDVRSWVDEIRRLRPDLPLVLIADFDPETDGLEQVVVLRKPIRLPDLTRVVGLTLGRSGSD
ncbi:MAG: hypothetical protein OEV00_05195 [Acidobacteriota bacterium]|nr:hypothetical protein [Acidobacteriota bacterium]